MAGHQPGGHQPGGHVPSGHLPGSGGGSGTTSVLGGRTMFYEHVAGSMVFEYEAPNMVYEDEGSS
jgi:hypothetical protein